MGPPEMPDRPKTWVAAVLVSVLVLALLSGATPVHWYSATIEHVPSVVPEAHPAVARRPILSTVWVTGLGVEAADALGLEPDLLVRMRRLDWQGTWWTPLWKSGTLSYAVDAEVFGGGSKGGLDLHYEGGLRATFRGLCSPDLAREVLLERLQEHVQAEVRVLAGS
jgi:hypothetical protein